MNKGDKMKKSIISITLILSLMLSSCALIPGAKVAPKSTPTTQLTMMQRISVLETNDTGYSQSITALNAQYAQDAAEVTALQDQVNTLTSQVASLSAEVQALGGKTTTTTH